jgi:hypothetical protein
VLNHGNHWEYRGEIVSIDSENDWETSRKTKSVDMMDLQKYSVSEKSPRKRQPTEFFLPQPNAKISNENMSTENEIKSKFYSHNNSAKLCAEGSLVNLLDPFGCCKEDIEGFWDIVRDQSLDSVCVKLGETFVPKKFTKKGEELIQLKKGFGFFAKKSISNSQQG